MRIDHIGSTSVPDFPAKDVIDIQITIAAPEVADELIEPLLAAGYPQVASAYPELARALQSYADAARGVVERGFDAMKFDPMKLGRDGKDLDAIRVTISGSHVARAAGANPANQVE